MMNKIVETLFDSVPQKAWKQKVQYLLMGENFEQQLIRKTSDQISILPYYTPKDCPKKIANISQEVKTDTAVHIDISNETTANTKAIDAISKGVDTVFFSLHHPLVNLEILLKGISTKVVLQCFFLDVHFPKKLDGFKNVTLLIDPLGKLSRTGDWFTDKSLDINSTNKLLANKAIAVSINLSVFQNAGASASQQLGYAISQLEWYLNTLKTLSSITYLVSCDTDIVVEAAKIKSLKALHTAYCQEVGKTIPYAIIQQKSSFNLRAFPSSLNPQLENIEQLIGFQSGVNTICSMPEHFAFFEEDLHFAQDSIVSLVAVSKKQLPKFEGTLAIEKICFQLVEKSIFIFSEIHKHGGVLKQLEKGTIQAKITKNSKKLAKDFKVKHETIFESKLPKTYPFSKPNKKYTTVKPLLPQKQSELLEQPLWESLPKLKS